MALVREVSCHLNHEECDEADRRRILGESAEEKAASGACICSTRTASLCLIFPLPILGNSFTHGLEKPILAGQRLKVQGSQGSR